MTGFTIYLKKQIKRMMGAIPAILAMSLILAAAFCLLNFLNLSNRNDSASQKIGIGIVGDMDQDFFGLGIQVLTNLDSSSYSISFQVIESEDEAALRLENGEIMSYIVIPDDFVHTIMNGGEMSLKFVTGGSQSGIGARLVMELTNTISTMMSESEAGTYGMMDFYVQNGQGDESYAASTDLVLKYFNVILGRENIYNVVELQGRSSITMREYYLCSLIVVFLLIWGITASSLLIKRDHSLDSLLKIHGLNALGQVLAELLAYLVLMSICFYLIFTILAICSGPLHIEFPCLLSFGHWAVLGISIFPILLCTAALHFIFYSITRNIITGILLNFLGTCVFGYICGCFYPSSFFPKAVQKICSFLPTGASLEYLKGSLQGSSMLPYLLMLAAYTIIFAALSVLIRERKLVR